jgi:pimeloyl-ACP methyl ester carboxylesterase
MNTFDHTSGTYLEIDGARIYYEVSGLEDRLALLMLHGGFGTIEDFNAILPDIHKEFRVIGMDSRGQGKSTLGPETLTYERIQKDAERVLEHLGVDTLSIMGFSDGGIVAYRLATLSNLSIEKLVTIDSRWHVKNTEPTRETFLKITGESWRQKFPDIYDAYQRLNPEPDFDRLAKSLIQMWLDPNPSGYVNEAVQQISCPLLIVRGDDDHLISLEAVAELRGLVEHSRLLNIPFAGHAAFQDQQDIFKIALNQFFEV